MDEQLQAQLLAQLKDVHVPEAVSWWPLAIGWWILAMVSLLTLSLTIYFFWKRHKQNRYRQLALTELASHFSQWQSQDCDKNYIAAANNLLKRVIRAFKPSVVNQFSDNWVDSLDAHAKTNFSKEARFALAHQCYQEHVQADINALHLELSHWLKHHKREVDNA